MVIKKRGRTTISVPRSIFVKNAYKGQVGYFTSVMLIFIGFAFFGIFILQNTTLTGAIITDVDLPTDCEDTDIEAVWDSVFEESSTGISIIKDTGLVGGKCAEYFANKSDTNEANYTYILHGYTKEESGENVSYVIAEKINATGAYLDLLDGLVDIEDMTSLPSRDEDFIGLYVYPRIDNITAIADAEIEFDSIFVTEGISLVEDDFFSNESFSFDEDLSTATMDVSNNGFVVGNYSYSFFSFNSKVIEAEDDCVVNESCGNWSDCLNNSKTKHCVDINECGSNTDYNETIACGLTCAPDWEIGNWSECFGGLQIRTVFDLNSCGNETEMPALNQTCGGCISDWSDCTDWTPEICPEDGLQERTCTDKNICDADALTKNETQSCIYKTNKSWIFILIVLFVIGTILGIVILILSLAKKNEDDKIGEIAASSPLDLPTQPTVTSTIQKPMRKPFVKRFVRPIQRIIPKPIQKPVVVKPVQKINPKKFIPTLVAPKLSSPPATQQSTPMAMPPKPPVQKPIVSPAVSAKPILQKRVQPIAKPATQNILTPTKKVIKK